MKQYLKEVGIALIIISFFAVVYLQMGFNDSFVGEIIGLILLILTLLSAILAPFAKKNKYVEKIVIICLSPLALVFGVMKIISTFFLPIICTFMTLWLNIFVFTFLFYFILTQGNESFKEFMLSFLPITFTLSAIITTNWGSSIVKFFYNSIGQKKKSLNPFNKLLIKWLFYVFYFIILSIIFFKNNSEQWIHIENRFTSQNVISSFAVYIAFDRIVQHDFVKKFNIKKIILGFFEALND